jgi:hypothetical protein
MANSQAQADLTIGTSNEITQMHRDSKLMISDLLSGLVVKATGQLIFGESSEPSGPVLWLNHDIVARRLNASHPDDLLPVRDIAARFRRHSTRQFAAGTGDGI